MSQRGWVAPEMSGPGAPRGFIEVPASHCRVDPERRASGGAGASGSHLAAPGEKEGTRDEYGQLGSNVINPSSLPRRQQQNEG
jgi:hypothetical protein